MINTFVIVLLIGIKRMRVWIDKWRIHVLDCTHFYVKSVNDWTFSTVNDLRSLPLHACLHWSHSHPHQLFSCPHPLLCSHPHCFPQNLCQSNRLKKGLKGNAFVIVLLIVIKRMRGWKDKWRIHFVESRHFYVKSANDWTFSTVSG